MKTVVNILGLLTTTLELRWYLEGSGKGCHLRGTKTQVYQAAALLGLHDPQQGLRLPLIEDLAFKIVTKQDLDTDYIGCETDRGTPTNWLLMVRSKDAMIRILAAAEYPDENGTGR